MTGSRPVTPSRSSSVRGTYNNKWRSLLFYTATNDITHCHQDSPKDRWQMESLHSWVCLGGHLLAGQAQNSNRDLNWNPRPPQMAILDKERQRIYSSLSWGGFSSTQVRWKTDWPKTESWVKRPQQTRIRSASSACRPKETNEREGLNVLWPISSR